CRRRTDGRPSQRQRYCQEGSAHLGGRFLWPQDDTCGPPATRTAPRRGRLLLPPTKRRARVTRSVYVTGIDRGDGRQIVELGVMELLTRQVDRVGVFRPLVHDGPDRLFELLRARYRLTQDPATVYGLDYNEASALQAEQGTDELVSTLVDRFHLVARDYEVVLVL